MPTRTDLKPSQLRLEALVGTGSFAEVWRARTPSGDRVALKRLLPQVARNPSAVAAFKREAGLLAKVDHPCVPSLIAAGCDDNGHYLVLEYVAGTTLGQLLGSPVPVPIALRVVRDVLSALEAVHELRDEEGHRLGLVHRDLSPGNVLVSEAGVAKLADFGIARAHVGTLATTGVMAKGTLGYMSPEQARGEPVDARSDLFAVGALLHALLSGEPPYDEQNPRLALARARAGDIKAFCATMPEAKPALCDLVDRALSSRPADRFPSAAAMRSEVLLVAEAVGGLASDEAVGAWAHQAPRDEIPIEQLHPAPAQSPSKKPKGAIAALALLFAAAIAVLVATVRPPAATTAGSSTSPSQSSLPLLLSSPEISATQGTATSSSVAAPQPSTPPRTLPKASEAVGGGEDAILDVGSEPSFAYVSIDGRRVGATPLFGQRLRPGNHVVVVQREGLGSKTFTIELRPGSHVSRVVKLP